MKADAKQANQASADGKAAGAWLADHLPLLLLREYGGRPVYAASTATQNLSALIDELRKAIGPAAGDPAVEKALHRVDGAVWELVVEYEDRAWHAAWTLAMSLRSGR